jgi:hypothetical protein
MTLLRQLLKGLPKFHWLEKKEKTARETKVYSDEEVISLLVEAQLRKEQYNTRLQAKTKGCNIYPSYNKVRVAKERCYPDSIIVTEEECELKLQQLLHHSTKCLLLAQKEVVTAAVPAKEMSKSSSRFEMGLRRQHRPFTIQAKKERRIPTYL